MTGNLQLKLAMVKVLYLGPAGTYSHQAVLQQFADEELIPTNSIPSCFKTLIKDEDIDYGVVPLENSTNGQVVFTYDLFRDFMQSEEEPKLEVVGEQYVDIAHCLIAPAPLEVDKLRKIGTIYSHPQVWGQVKDYLADLEKKYGKFTKIDCNSTSEAVTKCIQEWDSKERITLAIGSRASAKLNKGFIVDSGINDIKGNTTRFLILRRRKPNNRLVTDCLPPNTDSKKVNLVTFVTKQDDPGSLVDVLNVLKDQRLNMCSISSRPFHADSLAGRKWQYCFFIEFYHSETTDYELLMEKFDEYCAKWIHWGRFYRNPSYYQVS